MYLDKKASKMENMDFASADQTPPTWVKVNGHKKYGLGSYTQSGTKKLLRWLHPGGDDRGSHIMGGESRREGCEPLSLLPTQASMWFCSCSANNVLKLWDSLV